MIYHIICAYCILGVALDEGSSVAVIDHLFSQGGSLLVLHVQSLIGTPLLSRIISWIFHFLETENTTSTVWHEILHDFEEAQLMKYILFSGAYYAVAMYSAYFINWGYFSIHSSTVPPLLLTE